MAVDNKGKELPKGIIQRTDGRYMGRFMYKGETYTLYDKNSVKRLQKAMNDLKYELEHGLYANASKVNVDKWFNTWMEEYKANTVKKSTYRLYEDYYNLYIKKSLAKKQIKDLRPIHIQKLYNDMAKQGMKTNTLKKVDTILRGMLKQAVKNEILLRNPCESVEIPKIETKERRVLTPEEQQEFMQYVRTHARWKKYDPLFTLALATGLRIGELLALNWNNIDFAKKTITINKTLQYIKNKETNKLEYVMQTPKTKTSKRTVPLLDSLVFVLKRHKREQEKRAKRMGDKWEPLGAAGFENLVFATEFGKPIDRNSINRVLTSVVNEMNKERVEPFEHFSPHTLRHTFATRCFENGIPPKVVQEYLGHSTLQMTMDLYTHVMEETKTEEIKKLEKIFKQA